MAETAAYGDFDITTNATWEDALQFGGTIPGCTGATGPAWSFVGQNFRLDVKGNKEQAVALLSVTSAAGEIVVDDPIGRILHTNVPETVINAALVPGEYLYDLVMFDGSTPPVRVILVQGKLKLRTGITGG
jgi:hypothetical protein